MKINYNDIKRAQESNLWTIGNKCLYDLCETYPLHTDKSVFISKVWLIGRTYSASVERRKQNTNITNDNFYENVIGEGMLKIGSKIDESIKSLKKYSKVSKENIELILGLHHLLTNTFKKLTGMSKRSLASKYLHFHLPKLFYIYDSRAKSAINEVFRNNQGIRLSINANFGPENYDEEYSKFVLKMYTFNLEIKKHYSVWLIPREIDNLLLVF